jgi:hypothetical protein
MWYSLQVAAHNPRQTPWMASLIVRVIAVLWPALRASMVAPAVAARDD